MSTTTDTTNGPTEAEVFLRTYTPGAGPRARRVTFADGSTLTEADITALDLVRS